MRRVVDFPQPDRSDKDNKLAIGDLQADIFHRRHVAALLAGINFENVFDGDLGHGAEGPK